jgi:hypothetical protein
MAGKIVADTLEHSTAGSIATNYVVEGSAKAWGHIAAGGASLTDSFNFSSIDDDGTGEYGLNYTSAMNNATYAANTTVTFNHTSSHNVRHTVIESKTTSSIEVDNGYSANNPTYWVAYDIATDASIAIHGDLA